MALPGVWQELEDTEEQGNLEKTDCKVICDDPTTPTTKGLMVMMMLITVMFLHTIQVVRLTVFLVVA